MSTEGRYSWSGIIAAQNAARNDGPLLTIEAARDRLRHVRQIRKVVLRGGRYPLSKTLVFTPEDSGTTYEAYPGEHPVISGGERIGGWKKGAGNLWTAHIDAVQQGQWNFHSLFVDENRAQRARTPNQGYFRIAGSKPPEKPFALRYRGDDINPKWAGDDDAEVVALFAWADLRRPIRKVDPATHTAILAGEALPYNQEANARYYIEGAADTLDFPGEWHLNRRTGTLSYLARKSEDPSTSEFVAPRLTELVRFDGHPVEGRFVENVTLRGLTFRDADWNLGPDGYVDVQAAVEVGSAITATGAVGCAIERCTIAGVGNYAIHLREGCRRNVIAGNNIYDVGAGGVRIGVGNGGTAVEEIIHHPDPALQARDNVVTGNDIHDAGKVFPSGVGVWIGHESYDSRISHNRIHDLDYSAISVCWTWGYDPNPCSGHIVEYNHLYNVGRGELSDLGAIYTLGTQPGTVIRGNLIHDVNCFSYGGWGIYLDEGSSEILVENNLVYRTKNGGFHQHYGRHNTVRNNIFALGKEYQWTLSKRENHLSLRAEGNIFYWEQGELFGDSFKPSGFWPVCDEPIKVKYAQPAAECKPFDFSRNIYYLGRHSERPLLRLLSERQSRGFDRDSVVGDPGFRDASALDFNLDPNGLAVRRGFRPFDYRSVGPRKAAERERQTERSTGPDR